MKVMLIVNPSASAVTARARVMIQNALSADHDLVVSETSRRGHATRLAQSAATSGYDLVISLGGDGTVNEVVNGLVRTSTALGVLPGGSTNVFARTLGFKNEPVAATEQLLHSLRRNAMQRIGLGNVNGRFFCFHVGIGLDAAVVEQVEKRGQLKRWFGHPLFIYAAMDTWARHFDRDSPQFASSINGDERDGFFAIVLNTDPYTYLGSKPLSLAPNSNLENGLSVVNMSSVDLVPTVRALANAVLGRPLAGGSRSTKSGVTVTDDVNEVTIRGYRAFPWQVDGDYLGESHHLTIRWEPQAVTIVLP